MNSFKVNQCNIEAFVHIQLLWCQKYSINVLWNCTVGELCTFRVFFGLVSAGVFAFFFFSGRVKAFENTAPNLHYYWVPILVSAVILLFPFCCPSFFGFWSKLKLLYKCFKWNVCMVPVLRRWWLARTSSPTDSSVCTPCVWTLCSSVSVSNTSSVISTSMWTYIDYLMDFTLARTAHKV